MTHRGALIIDRRDPERIVDGARWQPLTMSEMARIAERMFAGEPAETLLVGLRQIDDVWCRWVGNAPKEL